MNFNEHYKLSGENFEEGLTLVEKADFASCSIIAPLVFIMSNPFFISYGGGYYSMSDIKILCPMGWDFSPINITYILEPFDNEGNLIEEGSPKCSINCDGDNFYHTLLKVCLSDTEENIFFTPNNISAIEYIKQMKSFVKRSHLRIFDDYDIQVKYLSVEDAAKLRITQSIVDSIKTATKKLRREILKNTKDILLKQSIEDSTKATQKLKERFGVDLEEF